MNGKLLSIQAVVADVLFGKVHYTLYARWLLVNLKNRQAGCTVYYNSILIVVFTLLGRFNNIYAATYYESMLLAIKYDVYHIFRL